MQLLLEEGKAFSIISFCATVLGLNFSMHILSYGDNHIALATQPPQLILPIHLVHDRITVLTQGGSGEIGQALHSAIVQSPVVGILFIQTSASYRFIILWINCSLYQKQLEQNRH